MNATISHLTDDKEERILLSRVLDKAEACQTRNFLTYTPFLSPRVQMLANRLLANHDGTYHPFGGYPGAERNMLFFLPDYETALPDPTDPDCPICALQTKFTAENPLTHRDFLGALLGSGISREKLGDILVADTHCTVVLQKELQHFLQENMVKAGRAKLQWMPLPLSQIEAPSPTTQDIQDTVSSLRLDAVCATGFSLSRAKAAAQITAGNVSHNYKTCLKPEQAIHVGDVISARGFGKFHVEAIGGQSRKGRTFIHLKRYQ